jgi:hypothetical protein
MRHLPRFLLILAYLIPYISAGAQSSDQISIKGRFDLDVGGIEMYSHSGLDSFPLLFSDDSTTSGLVVLDGNIAHKILQKHDYQFEIFEDENISTITYHLPNGLNAWMSLSKRADGPELILSWGAYNGSTRRKEIQVHLLLDTILGESGAIHFLTKESSITREKQVILSANGEQGSNWIWSGTAEDKGFFLFVSPELQQQNRLLATMANWKRLSDLESQPLVNENRNFNLLPFSVNDSAILLSPDVVSLRPKESSSTSVVVHYFPQYPDDFDKSNSPIATENYILPNQENFFSEYLRINTEEVTTPSAEGRTTSVASDRQHGEDQDSEETNISGDRDIETIRRILSRINYLLSQESHVDPNEIRELENTIQTLRREHTSE